MYDQDSWSDGFNCTNTEIFEYIMLMNSCYLEVTSEIDGFMQNFRMMEVI